MTERKLEECVSNSLRVEGARELAAIGYKKAQWEKAHANWLSALKAGDIVANVYSCSPHEIVARNSDTFSVKNLHNGNVKDTEYGFNLAPYTEKDMYGYRNSERIQTLTEKVNEAIKSGDEKKIAALESALK
jgi:hypothetical protein